MAIAEEHIDQRRDQRAIGAGPGHDMDIGGFGRRRPVGIDDNQLRAPVLARLGHMGHHIDLGRDRIAAPDHDQVAFRHLARIDAVFDANAGEPSRICNRVADRAFLPRIAQRMAEPVQPVAAHQPHRARVMIGEHRFAAIAIRHPPERRRRDIQRLVPGDWLEGRKADALLAHPAQRLGQPVRVMHPFGIARDLGADHAVGVAVILRTAHPADPVAVQALDLQRAGRGAVMRTGGGDNLRGHNIHSIGNIRSLRFGEAGGNML